MSAQPIQAAGWSLRMSPVGPLDKSPLAARIGFASAFFFGSGTVVRSIDELIKKSIGHFIHIDGVIIQIHPVQRLFITASLAFRLERAHQEFASRDQDHRYPSGRRRGRLDRGRRFGWKGFVKLKTSKAGKYVYNDYNPGQGC